jgi:cell division protease FtsH
MKTAPNKKSGLFGFILPYLLMGVAVIVFIWLVFFQNPGTTIMVGQTDLADFLNTKEVTQVTTIEKETITQVTGTYVDTEGKTVYFTATFETSNTYIKDAVDQVLATRPGAEPGTFYYNAGVWTSENAFQTNWFEIWGPTLLIVGGSAALFFFLFSRMNASVNSSNSKALDFNKSRARREDTSKIRFTDVAGCEEEKAEMMEIVQYLKEPKKFSKFGAKLPRGVLLVGPPGTGKTLLAKAVAGEAGVPFYSISGADFVEMFVGVGAGRVRDMFRRAKQTAPCLVFIDELDAVGRQRGAGMGGGNDEREQTLNQLLVEMDGFSDNSGVMVIAATNREDVLDPALLRAGRFDRQITVNLPDRLGRAAIFRVHARNKKIDPSVDFDNLARRTVGFSGADIENILNEAAILAVRVNREQVLIEDIDEAIDRRIAGPAKSSRALNEHERRAIAYHEAGHAIIGLNLKHSDKVQKITIVPRGRTGGHVLMTPEEDRFLVTKKELQARIVGYLGGRSSEEIFFSDISTGAQNDIEVATRIARLMVTEYGMSSLGPIQYESDSASVFLGRDYNSTQKNFSTQIAFEIDTEVRKIIDEAHQEAHRILNEHKEDVILLAETLLEKETIASEEIQYLLTNRKLPNGKNGKKPPAPTEAAPANDATEGKA